MGRSLLPNAGLQIHINGPCLLSARSGGYPVQGPLNQIGISEKGFEISIQRYDEAIHADTGGSKLPIDLLELGMDATIRGQLVIYDLGALTNWFRILGNESAEGQLPAIGRPIGLSGNATGIVLSSTTDEPWRFFTCRCRATKQHISTRHTVYDLEIYAYALIGTATSPQGIPLYDHNGN